MQYPIPLFINETLRAWEEVEYNLATIEDAEKWTKPKNEQTNVTKFPLAQTSGIEELKTWGKGESREGNKKSQGQ